jgi:hypothetical protein
MVSIQVYDTLSILFKLEKPHVEHLEDFILLLREGGEMHNFFKTFNRKFERKNSKEFPIGSVKAGASWWEECLR